MIHCLRKSSDSKRENQHKKTNSKSKNDKRAENCAQTANYYTTSLVATLAKGAEIFNSSFLTRVVLNFPSTH